MTGFLRSLLIRGAGPSAARGLQFAAVSARPRLPPAVPEDSAGPRPVSSIAARDAAPLRPQPRAGPGAPQQPLAAPAAPRIAPLPQIVTSAAAQRAPAQPAPIAPTKAPALGATNIPPAAAPIRAGDIAEPPRPAREGRNAPPPEPSADRVRIEPQLTHTEAKIETATPPAPIPPAEPLSPLRPPLEPAPASGAIIEIGRIEIVVAPALQPAARQEPERTRGFAGYEQRRLGPRR